MNYRKPTFWIIVTAVVVCMAVAVCFLTDPITEGSVIKWLDYTEDNSEMSYERELTIPLEEFPGVTFCYTPEQLAAVTEDGERRVLFEGMPIWSVYFCDLNDDGYLEICSESSFGSGMIDERIIAYDYANGMSYLLSGRGEYDYYLRLDEGDGRLCVDKCIYNSGELVSSEPLRLEDFAIQIDTQPRVILMAKILEIHDSYYLVEPVEGSREVSSADKIEIPMKNMYPSPEPGVGDILQIEYDGQIAETYPARITNVYHISVAEQVSAISMIPTDTERTGLQAGALLVPIDGDVYRYELTEENPRGVTVDKLLFTFTEETHPEGIVWEVYSLKQYPDCTAVLMCADNREWLYRYSPPLRCSDTALDDAIKAGFVVTENGLGSHGQDTWREFYEQTQQGKEATVTVARYQTLDPARCSAEFYEIFQQDYPSLTIYALHYDGSQFAFSFDEGRATFIYEYLMKYETPVHSIMSSQEPQYRDTYILTHDNRVTYDQLWQSAASSQLGAYIDHYLIYSEAKTE